MLEDNQCKSLNSQYKGGYYLVDMLQCSNLKAGTLALEHVLISSFVNGTERVKLVAHAPKITLFRCFVQLAYTLLSRSAVRHW